MKANELMIDDWVMYRGKPIIVYEIDEYYDRINTEPDGYDSIRCIELSDLQPIPLTAQILRKNGFEKVNGEYQDVFYCCDGLDLLIDYRIEPYGYTLYGVLELHIKYLHQLQHALRLAGIDKEITI